VSSADRPLLARLAARLRIVPSYFDLSAGSGARAATQALCTAMGSPSASEAEAGATAALDAAMPDRVIGRCACSGARAPRARTARDPARELHASGRGARIRFEDGTAYRGALRVPAGDGRTSAELTLPVRVPVGAHELRLHLPDAAGGRTCEQTLVVAPRSGVLAREILGDARALGLWASLYTVRSQRGFGFGDFGDLARLARLAAELGTDFLAINPLHALYGRGDAIAPYSPKSRVFQNVLYLDVESVPELTGCPEGAHASTPLRSRCCAPRTSSTTLRCSTRSSTCCARCTPASRAANARARAAGRAFAEFRAQPCAEDFAVFEALQAEPGEPDGAAGPRASAIRAPRRSSSSPPRAREVELHAWLQFELDTQLNAQPCRRATGLALGLVKDLAIGSAADSADAWANPGLFAHGRRWARCRTPTGERSDWGLPPLIPQRLREEGYAYLRRVLRAAFRCAGACASTT
jgi:hypothetical protein